MSTVTGGRQLAPLLPMLFAQSRATFIGYWRIPAFSVTSIALPVMFFIFFGLPHAKEHFSNGASVGAYLLASFGAYAVSSMMVFSFGIGTAQARGTNSDVLGRATPLPPLIAIAAHVLTALAFALVALVILFVFGALVGGVSQPAGSWAGLTLRLLLGSLPMIGLGMAIGYGSGPNAAPAIANVVYLPVAFASGLFIPVSALPDFVQKLATYLPLYHYGQLGWGIAGHADEPLLTSIVWLAGWTVVFFALALRFYRLEEDRKFS